MSLSPVLFTINVMQIYGNITFTGGKTAFDTLKDAVVEGETPAVGEYICDAGFYDFSFWSCIGLWVSFLFTTACGIAAKFCNCFYNVLCCR